ncbi:MAG: phospholipase effector Tle1 domain-containing protein [Flavobacterium sp.]
MNSQAKNNADLLKDIEKHRIAYENNAPVKIRFVGLFDTVVAQMIIKNHLGKKLDIVNFISPSPIKLPFGIGTLAELSFDKVKQKIDHLPIQQVVHLIAKDEWRANFASIKAGMGNNIFEIALRGAHSDIGGGYMAKKEDRDIVDFEYETTFDKNNIPKSDRLDTLKNFYKVNGYAKEENIKIVDKLIFEDYNSDWDTTKYHYLKQLVITRQIKPRFSIVNMKVMQALAIESGLIFNDTIPKYDFELDTPKDLEKYQEELINYVLEKFKGKQPKPIKNPVQKQKFLHLSANYNSAALFDRAGENITGIKLLDNIFYYNAPRYENNNRNSYKREDYTHNK